MKRSEAEREITSRVQSVYVGHDLVLTRVLGHPKMYLHTHDIGFSAHVMLDGYWEIWLTLVLARLVKPGMVTVDVGANYGYYSLVMGNAAGPKGYVLAVEPNPEVAAVLIRTFELNGLNTMGRVECVAAGAVDVGHVDLFIPKGEPKNGTIVASGFKGDNGIKVSVPGRTIDSLCAGLSRVDVVKIDVEGAEVDVIAGMAQTIARFRPTIVLEFNAARYADPVGFLETFAGSYPPPRLIAFDGTAAKVSRDALLGEHVADDKLLLFEAAS